MSTGGWFGGVEEVVVGGVGGWGGGGVGVGVGGHGGGIDRLSGGIDRLSGLAFTRTKSALRGEVDNLGGGTHARPPGSERMLGYTRKGVKGWEGPVLQRAPHGGWQVVGGGGGAGGEAGHLRHGRARHGGAAHGGAAPPDERRARWVLCPDEPVAVVVQARQARGQGFLACLAAEGSRRRRSRRRP